MTEEQDILVCVDLDAEHVELSELDVCRGCGAQIWVSPSGRELQREKDLKLICFDCIPAEENLEFAPMSPKQMLEVVQHLRTSRPRGESDR